MREIDLGSSDDSEEEDLDGDPRGKRGEGDFYQNVDEQLYLRSELEEDLNEGEISNLINISNPRGQILWHGLKTRSFPIMTKL